MRKILISLLTITLIAIFVLMITKGLEIAEFQVYSIQQIKEANDNLDNKIGTLQTSIATQYTSEKASLDASVKKLQESKQRYQDAITYSTEEEIEAANQTEEYEIGYLWTKIGLYATKNNVTMQANVTASNIPGQYTISFTAIGPYISLSDFVYAIENDSELGFRIEDFALTPYSRQETTTDVGVQQNLQATFRIRNVSINQDSLKGTISASQDTTQEMTQDTTQNTTQDVEQQTVEQPVVEEPMQEDVEE